MSHNLAYRISGDEEEHDGGIAKVEARCVTVHHLSASVSVQLFGNTGSCAFDQTSVGFDAGDPTANVSCRLHDNSSLAASKIDQMVIGGNFCQLQQPSNQSARSTQDGAERSGSRRYPSKSLTQQPERTYSRVERPEGFG